MGQRLLDAHSDLLTSCLRHGPHAAYDVYRDSLPEDAWIVRVEMLDIGIDRYPGVVRFTLESSEWPELEANETTLQITPRLRMTNAT